MISTLEVSWVFLVSIMSTLEVSWDYLVSIISTLQVSWDYLVSIISTLEVSWDYLVSKISTLEVSWEYLVSIVSTLEVSWDYLVSRCHFQLMKAPDPTSDTKALKAFQQTYITLLPTLFLQITYEVRDLFPWEMLIKTVISCFLNVEKIRNSAQINLSSALNIYRSYLFDATISTEQSTSEIDADLTQNDM